MNYKEQLQEKYKSGDTAYGFMVKVIKQKETGDKIIKYVAPRKGYFMPEYKKKKNAELITDDKNLVDYPVNYFLQCPYGTDGISYNDTVSIESRTYADTKLQAKQMYLKLLEKCLEDCKNKKLYIANYDSVCSEIRKVKKV